MQMEEIDCDNSDNKDNAEISVLDPEAEISTNVLAI
jgi:hypothetical protein